MLTAAIAVCAAATLSYGVWLYSSTSAAITRADDVLQPEPPDAAHRSGEGENYLVIGSDSRAGANSSYGEVAGARSDTTILAHVSADRSQITLVSLPRDAWVEVPECPDGRGGATEAYRGMLNSAYARGGAACAVRTVQHLTGLRIDHYVEFDFAGFGAVVDALGGVDVEAPGGKAVYDPDSGLRMHAGINHLDGKSALAYVRARHNLGDGSDLGRIERQQKFMAALAGSASAGGRLLNPRTTSELLHAVAGHTTLDRDTQLTNLLVLAQAVNSGTARAVFRTAPIAVPDYDPEHGNLHGGGRVLLDEMQGEALYHALAADEPIG